jgi:hypothetical protein
VTIPLARSLDGFARHEKNLPSQTLGSHLEVGR